jgi:hypothetical protein
MTMLKRLLDTEYTEYDALIGEDYDAPETKKAMSVLDWDGLYPVVETYNGKREIIDIACPTNDPEGFPQYIVIGDEYARFVSDEDYDVLSHPEDGYESEAAFREARRQGRKENALK